MYLYQSIFKTFVNTNIGLKDKLVFQPFSTLKLSQDTLKVVLVEAPNNFHISCGI